jgi:hypothetical protein
MRQWILTTAILSVAVGCSASAGEKPVVDRVRHEVRITARVQPGAMARPLGVQGHHAIVWKEGRAKTWALFASDASDHDVRLALDSLGAHRGENLTPASWNERDDPKNPEPDKRVTGTPVDVFVEWDGSRGPVPLARLLAEKGQPRPKIDMRYGGNEQWQKDFHSGCIVCLYSCPGGAIGNHAHPIRDYVRDGVVYSALRNALPPAGTRVTIILKPRLEAL